MRLILVVENKPLDVCLCVAVECRWRRMNREGGEGESVRDLGKSIGYL